MIRFSTQSEPDEPDETIELLIACVQSAAQGTVPTPLQLLKAMVTTIETIIPDACEFWVPSAGDHHGDKSLTPDQLGERFSPHDLAEATLVAAHLRGIPPFVVAAKFISTLFTDTYGRGPDPGAN